MVLPVGLTGMIRVLLEEPCCPCSCSTVSAMALCNLNHLCQHAQVKHVRTYKHTDRQTYIQTPTHARTHGHMCTAAQCAASQQAQADCPQCHFFPGACIITGLHVSSLGHMHHHWTTCIITGPHACRRPYAQACWTYGRRHMSGQGSGPLIFSESMSHGL